MRITLDKTTDMAYIFLENTIKSSEVKKTYTCDPFEIDGEINLDFNSNGVLVGIEVSSASKKLPKIILELAEIL